MSRLKPIEVKRKKSGIKWKAVVGLVIVAIMVGSGFIMAGSNNEEEELPENAFKVSDYTFYETPEGDYGTYMLRQDGTLFPIVFRADPRNVTDIYMDIEVPEVIRGAKRVYLTYSPNQANLSKVVVATAQLARIVPLTNGYRPVLSYTEDTEPIDETIPLKTCEDTTNTTIVILFEVAGITDIVNENNCIHVRGKDYDDLIIASDKLGMNLLGMRL